MFAKFRNAVLGSFGVLGASLSSGEARADCIYYFNSENGKNFFQTASGWPPQLFPERVAIIGGLEELGLQEFRNSDYTKVDHLGHLMNFDCLVRPTDGSLDYSKRYSPENLRLFFEARDFLKDRTLHIRLRRQPAYMTAEVDCDTVTLNFDPDRVLPPDDAFDAALEDVSTKDFMGSVIALLSAAKRTGETGNYVVPNHYSDPTMFVPVRKGCAAPDLVS